MSVLQLWEIESGWIKLVSYPLEWHYVMDGEIACGLLGGFVSGHQKGYGMGLTKCKACLLKLRGA